MTQITLYFVVSVFDADDHRVRDLMSGPFIRRAPAVQSLRTLQRIHHDEVLHLAEVDVPCELQSLRTVRDV